MSKHSGPRPPRRGQLTRRLRLLAAGITVTLVAWGVLVFMAIEFGRDARGGAAAAWVLLGVATLGAAACLYLTLVLGMKALEAVRARQEGDLPPSPASGSGSPAQTGSATVSASAFRPVVHSGRQPGKRRATR